VESDKFPKATFEGKIQDLPKVDLSAPGLQKVNVAGKLTIHGVTREIEAMGSLNAETGKITALSEFVINPEEFGIKIPQVVRKNIAEKIAVNVRMSYIPYKK
jgi:polyisoprenoid-binding protein YceI